MITIALACKRTDDRAAIAALLKGQTDFRVIKKGKDGYDALKAATTQRPDIIIMDFSMEDIGSLELAPIIRRESPSTEIIVLCSHNANAIGKALKAGISGCLFREDGFTHLAASIRSVYHGGWYVSKSGRGLLLNYSFPELGIPRLSFAPTETEMGIFCGIIRGHSDREIAQSLNINIGSLRNCITRIKKKTGLRNRAQIIIHALYYRQIRRCGI